MRRNLRIAWAILLPVLAVFSGCGGKEQPAGTAESEPGVKFGLDQDQRIAIFHEVENAIVENERRGREEGPEAGPECVEYVACLDDESKQRIASAHNLTLEQLEELIFEGERSGWSQW